MRIADGFQPGDVATGPGGHKRYRGGAFWAKVHDDQGFTEAVMNDFDDSKMRFAIACLGWKVERPKPETIVIRKSDVVFDGTVTDALLSQSTILTEGGRVIVLRQTEEQS